MEKLPLVAITIGYIIGSIWGLYCKMSIVFFYVPIILITIVMEKAKSLKIKNSDLTKSLCNVQKRCNRRQSNQKSNKSELQKRYTKKQSNQKSNKSELQKRYTKKQSNQKGNKSKLQKGCNKKQSNQKGSKSKLKILSVKRYKRYIKLIFSKNSIILIIISSIISNIYISSLNTKYNIKYAKYDQKEIQITAIVVSDKKEENYSDRYTIKLQNGDKLYLQTSKNTQIGYGEKIQIKGTYIEPEVQRNKNGFNYKEYLKTIQIYGTIKAKQIKSISKEEINKISLCLNKIRRKCEANIEKYFDKSISGILEGIFLGNTNNIEEETKQSFSTNNISHILAISGMHISYIMLITYTVAKSIAGKKKARIVTIILLTNYLLFTGCSVSATRATITANLAILAHLLHRKNNTWNSLMLSMLIILVINPFAIKQLGFQLSFGGTISILLFYKTILNFIRNTKLKYKPRRYTKLGLLLKNIQFQKNTFLQSHKKIRILLLYVFNKRKVGSKIIEAIALTLSAQIGIFPIILYNFHTVNFTFLLINLLVGFLMPPILFIGILFLISSFIENHIAQVLANILKFIVKILVYISKVGENLPFSKLYVITPKLIFIFLYYIFVIIFNFILKNSQIRKKSAFNIRVKNTVYLIFHNVKASILRFWKCVICLKINKKDDFHDVRKKINEQKRFEPHRSFSKLVVIASIICVLIYFWNKTPHWLEIHFIDVGQGDSTLIITPQNKKILVDGGGSENSSFNVGEKTLLPYLLNKQISCIDYMIISHFDTDHVGGLLFVLQNMKVKNVIVAKQVQSSENMEMFYKIVKEKKINTLVVKKGDKLIIEKDLHFLILSPDENNFIPSNPLNNNSIVCKLIYKNFSMLFTGDIEQEAEEQILKLYQDNLSTLLSTVLKVAHHGSRTSTTEQFLHAVNPKIALIGVGKNNSFGHPSTEILHLLQLNSIEVYRTDLCGEISVFASSSGIVNIKKHLSN